MPHPFTLQFLHHGQRLDLAWLRAVAVMAEDPFTLYEMLKKKNPAAANRYDQKFALLADGGTFTRTQGKILDFKDFRFFEFKDNASQSRMLSFPETFMAGKQKRTCHIIVSGFDGKKEDDIDPAILKRARDRAKQVQELLKEGSLKLGDWKL